MRADVAQTGEKMPKISRLTLEAKPDERFVLFDMRSRTTTKLKVFYRDNGNLAIAFEAPAKVRISREQQRSVGNDNTGTD